MRLRLYRLFKVMNWFVLIGWVCLFLLPLWPYTRPIVFAVIGVICCLYSYLIWIEGRWDTKEERRKVSIKGFFSLSGVMRLFENQRVVLAGWFHFLAFDLFVGLFIVMDGHQQGIAHIYLWPILFFTLMFGPFGLFLYLLLRLVLTLLG